MSVIGVRRLLPMVLAVLAALCRVGGVSADAEPGRLSLAEALRLARANSATLHAAMARVHGAEARLSGARSLASPTLSLAHAAGRDTGGTDEDVVVSQSLQLGDKRRQAIRGATADRNASEADRVSVQLEVAASIEATYFDALEADVEQKLATDNLATVHQFTVAAQVQFEAGDVARSNLLRAQVEEDRATQALAAASVERENRYAALKSAVGLPADAAVTLTDELGFAPAPVDPAALAEAALRNRPDIAAARCELQARTAALHAARTQGQPDLFIEGRRAALDPSVPGETVRVGLTLPLFDLGQQRADARAALAAVHEQEALVAETVRIARLEVAGSVRSLSQARAVVEAFRSGRLDRARELLEMARTGYDKGASSYLELLDAQQVYRSEQAEYARALCDYNKMLSALRKAVGGKL